MCILYTYTCIDICTYIHFWSTCILGKIHIVQQVRQLQCRVFILHEIYNKSRI